MEEVGVGGTYPALLLSSFQLLDWSGLGCILCSHWGRATQNRRPKEQKTGKKRKVWKESDGKQGKEIGKGN